MSIPDKTKFDGQVRDDSARSGPSASSASGGRDGPGRDRVRRGDLVASLVAVLAFCVALCAALALGANPRLSAGLRTGFAIAAVPFAILIVRLLPVGVYVEPGGIQIRNMLSSRRLRWGQIERFELGRWRGLRRYRCGVARLTDGGQVTIFALNPPYLAKQVVLPLIDDLNARLAQATGRSFAPATVDEDLVADATAR